MKRLLFALLLFVTCSVVVGAGIPQQHLDVSVEVYNGEGGGSGVVFLNGPWSYVWTDAHVVDNLQNLDIGASPTNGRPEVRCTYKDPFVQTYKSEDGRQVEMVQRMAKIIRFSKREDIALLKLYQKNAFKTSVVFSREVPEQGEAVWNVGSAWGRPGAGSVCDGTVSFTGRLRSHFKPDDQSSIIYDQVAVTATMGCSGGGVFRKDNGECIGLLTEFLVNIQKTPGHLIMTPSRRLLEFAKRTNCEYAVNDKVPVPDREEVITDDLLPAPENWALVRVNPDGNLLPAPPKIQPAPLPKK